MKENEKPRRTIYDLIRDDLIERHPRILNLLLGIMLVSLSFVAVFLAYDILSSGSHTINKDGLGGQFSQVPKETLLALKNWWTGAFSDLVKTYSSNGSSETLAERIVVRNVSPSGLVVSANSSPKKPAIAPRQIPSTVAAITASTAGSTNGSAAPVAKRHKSSGGQSKKVKVNESLINKTQANESQFNKSQLNVPMLNASKSDSSPTNGSQPSEPLAIQSAQLNSSKPIQSQTDGSESANYSQRVVSQGIQAPIMDSLQNKSLQYTSVPDPSKINQTESENQSQKKDSKAGQENLTNESRLSDPQSGAAEPMNESQTNGLPQDQSMALNKPEGETRMLPQAEATVDTDAGSNRLAPDDGGEPRVEPSAGSSASAQGEANSTQSNTTNSDAKAIGASIEPVARELNLTSALTDHQGMPAGQKISEESSAQSELQAGSSPLPLPNNSSGAVPSADAINGGDIPVINAPKFDSPQENNSSNVSSDTSGTGSKTVAESESTAKIDNVRTEEATKQYRPARAPRKPAPARQARSVSRR